MATEKKWIRVTEPVKVATKVLRRGDYPPGDDDYKVLQAEAEVEGGSAEYIDAPRVPKAPEPEAPPAPSPTTEPDKEPEPDAKPETDTKDKKSTKK